MPPLLAAAAGLASCAQSDEQFQATATVSPIASGPVAGGTPLPPVRDAAPATEAAAPKAAAGGPKRIPAREKVTQLATAIAAELAQRCPATDAADQPAFEACRKAMHGGSKLRASLSPVTLWGRNMDAEKALKDTGLTQFGPDVLTGMYLPLFMFTGSSKVTYNAREKLYRVELGARFRNRLQPGQFPYPFWHEDEKWSTYENANAILLWVDPASLAIRTAQFTAGGSLEPPASGPAVAKRTFDGKWMWTDAAGQQQPKVTLFDGLFRPENPHMKKLDAAYRELALSLREGQCMACHVPDNPYKTKRLVLLQTPAHAAAEIKRVMQTVRKGTMPLNATSGIEEPLAGALKGKLLERAATFEKVVDAAKAWEAAAAARPAPAATAPAATAPAATAPAPAAVPAAPARPQPTRQSRLEP